MGRKFLAEMIGTMTLVLLGCGSAVFNAGGAASSAWVLNVAFAFGLSVVAMAYTIGAISGCHINPAITLGVWVKGGIKTKEAVNYWIAQIIGALIGSSIIYLLVYTGAATGGVTTTGANGFASGGLGYAAIAETVFTFIFVLVVLGVTDKMNTAPRLAGLVIGLTLVLVHIVCIPITGTSVNPARSIAPAIFQGGEALSQLWVFIVFPMLGATIAAVTWKGLAEKKK